MKNPEQVSIIKKKKVAYIEASEYLSDLGDEYVDESDVNVGELDPRPPYICKLLKPCNRKNPVESIKNNKFVTKTYTLYNKV